MFKFKKRRLGKIQKKVKEFFKKMGFVIEVDLSIQNETLSIYVKSDEPQILIGEKGVILVHIQRLLRIILGREFGETFYVDLDINDYKKKKIQYLKEMANSIADEVVLAKKEKVLPSMSAYERRIIHLELADRQNVATESIDMEPERRVVIKPYP